MGLLKPNIAKLEKNRDLEGLIKAFRYPNLKVQGDAALALGRLGDLRAVEPLLAQARFTPEPVGQALQMIGPTAFDILIRSLEDPKVDLVVRRLVVSTLKENGDARAIQPLISLSRNDWQIQEEAIEAFKHLGQMYGPFAVPTLIKGLSYGIDGKTGFGAAETLIMIGQPAINQLIVALNDASKEIRLGAAYVLGRIGDVRAVEPLIASLNDPDCGVRGRVAESLGGIGDARVIGPLLSGIKDLKSFEPNFLVFANSLVNLGWMPGRDDLGARVCMAFSRWDLCAQIGEPAVNPLIGAFRYGIVSEFNDRISDTLISIGRPAYEPLMAALGHASEDVRIGSAYTLARLGEARGCEALAAFSGEYDDYIRRKAIHSLGRIGDARSLDPLIRSLSDPKWENRKIAAEGLIRLYKNGSMENCHKEKILAVRARITEPYRSVHHDKSSDCSGNSHEDEGIGLDFPI